jgi:hypothetical protein
VKSLACAHAVNFYLDDKYAAERERIISLSKSSDPAADALIMGYIREAQRMSHLSLSPLELILTDEHCRQMQVSTLNSLAYSVTSSQMALSFRATDCPTSRSREAIVSLLHTRMRI